jgi:hypothetical protein
VYDIHTLDFDVQFGVKMCDVCSFEDAVNWDKKGCFSNVMHLIQWQGSGKIICFRKIKDKKTFWHICNFTVVHQAVMNIW